MKQEIVSNKSYHHFLLKFQLPIVRHYVQFSIQLFPTMKKALGMTNRCEDGKYVIFLDYDDMTYTEVVDEAHRLIEDFHLGDFYIFSLDRPDSYHAICCTKLTVQKCQDVINASSADQAFKQAPRFFKRNRWILRIGKKGKRDAPNFEIRIHGYKDQPEAIGHLLFLKDYYGADVNLANDNPNNEKVQFINYETFNRV